MAAAPVVSQPAPLRSALPTPLRSLGFVPVLPTATPAARSGDSPFPKIVRTASGEAWLAAAGDVRSPYRGKAVARAVLRSELSVHGDSVLRGREERQPRDSSRRIYRSCFTA